MTQLLVWPTQLKLRPDVCWEQQHCIEAEPDRQDRWPGRTKGPSSSYGENSDFSWIRRTSNPCPRGWTSPSSRTASLGGDLGACPLLTCLTEAEGVWKSLVLAIKTSLNSVTLQEVLQCRLADLPLHIPEDKNQGRSSARVNVKEPAWLHVTDKRGNWETWSITTECKRWWKMRLEKELSLKCQLSFCGNGQVFLIYFSWPSGICFWRRGDTI